MGKLNIPVVSLKDLRHLQQIGFDIETLRRWKYSSVKTKIAWLGAALEFAHAKKKILKRKK